MSQPATGSKSSGGAVSAERANLADFSVVKALDKASPKLALFCCNGQHIKNITLELCRATGDKQKYMEYKLSDVLLSSVQVSGSGEGGVPTESWALHYSKIEMTYTQIGLDGKPQGKGASVGWDLKENKKV